MAAIVRQNDRDLAVHNTNPQVAIPLNQAQVGYMAQLGAVGSPFHQQVGSPFHQQQMALQHGLIYQPTTMPEQGTVVQSGMAYQNQLQQIQILQPSAQSNVTTQRRLLKKHKRAYTVLGTLQITCGVICLLANVTLIVENSKYAHTGHGIWGGIIFMVAGVLGLLCRAGKGKGIVISAMVLSVISAVLAAVVLINASVSLPYERSEIYVRHICRSYHNGMKLCQPNSVRRYRILPIYIIMYALMILFALLELVVSIVQSAYCCRQVCCVNSRRSIQQQYQPVIVYLNCAPTGQVATTAAVPPMSPMPPMSPVQRPAQYEGAVSSPPPYSMTSDANDEQLPRKADS